jgi:IS30 family transposase
MGGLPLNNMPNNKLDWKKPREVFELLLNSYVKQ